MIAEYMKIMEKRYNNSERNTKTQLWLVVQTHDFMSVTFSGMSRISNLLKEGLSMDLTVYHDGQFLLESLHVKKKGNCMGRGIFWGGTVR